MSAAFTARSTTKAKSRSTGWNGESSSTGLARVALAFGSGILSRITSKATSGPSASSASSARGCSSPKWPSTFCGPIWMVPARPGWNQAGPPGTACNAAVGGEDRERVGLDVEAIDLSVPLGGRHRPVPAAARCFGERAPHARSRDQLVLRLVAPEHLPNLEQRDVVEAAVGVLLCRADEAGDQARPHVGEVGRNRIGEHKLRLAAAEQLGLRFCDERPSD